MKGILLSALLLLVPRVTSAATTANPKIVFVGDQVTANWPLTQTNPNWINLGASSDIQAAIALHPNIIHILIGLVGAESEITNFQAAFVTPGVLAELQTMVSEARAANIQVILGLEPTGACPFCSSTNEVVAAYGAQQGITVINYQNAQVQSSPGYNSPTNDVPTAAGYQQMTALLEQALPTVNLILGGGYLQTVARLDGSTPVSNVNTVLSGTYVGFTAVGWYNDGSIHPQLNTNILGATGTWTSSNPLVMNIDQTGSAQALTAGTSIIRYTSLNGIAFNEWIMYVTDYAGE
jgi:hypothetical protein